MLFFEDNPFLVGLFGLVVIFLLRRSFILNKRSRKRNITQEARQNITNAQENASDIHKLEIRLYDYEREIEGRIRSKLTALDQLITQADQEIFRLTQVLDESRPGSDSTKSTTGQFEPQQRRLTQEQARATFDQSHRTSANSTGHSHHLNLEQRLMINNLYNAGFTADEIAKMMNRLLEDVQSFLDQQYPHAA